MIRTLILSLLLFSFMANAQEEVAVKQSIQNLFVGIQKGDTALVRSVFLKDALLETIKQSKETGAEIEKGDLMEFINSLANVPADVNIEERILSWDIRVDGPLATAWTEYTFFVNDEVSHCGVNAFQLLKEGESWKITKIIDTRYREGCKTSKAETVINTLIDNWHLAATKADADTFFGSMTEDGIYIGTDKTERWLRDELREWGAKAFERAPAWAFKSFDRHVYLSEDGKVAWWEEKLDTAMGICMGSGVLENTKEGWKIKHYHLGVTIDNDKLEDFMKIGN